MMSRPDFAACLGLVVGLVLFSTTAVTQSQPTGQLTPADEPAIAITPYRTPPAGSRYLVFISDLHLGVGRRPDGSWDPTEDFRWPKALDGFLQEVSRRGQDQVDLVIVGDFLELWQPPASIPCKGTSADLGCTLDEMESLSRLVVAAHSDSLSILRAFAERGENRLHVVPGNHDATLRYERVWRPLGEVLNVTSGRINLVESGIWTSPDERIVAEHGHQIGMDVNRYEQWPRIVRREGGLQYVIRPWGELFVQRLFNEQEETYPIIDNLSPESAGARYRAADRGLWGSAKDIARFIFFNLWETSPKQRGASLGPEAIDKREWSIKVARTLGADLFLKALPPEDELSNQIQAGGSNAEAVKAELAAMAKSISRVPDEAILHLCDLVADRGTPLCADPELGQLGQHLFLAKAQILSRHFRARQLQFRAMRVFIYGHTHQFETPCSVALNDLISITVANTGAFQRLIDEEGFLRVIGGTPPWEGLRTLRLEQLPPRYTAVIVADANSNPEVYAWHMPEDGIGALVTAEDGRCR
ncbi:metallophosphoesterase [Bradyrhizobium sp. 190]|uniref:metallophosphoesterase n=1 Tax=Bradyrhizobium sp. 190 TaxID=2782658 RepID=UPI001FF8890E|nr:metallophosphoesterase [Bradyrhizobium sp. 190]MCK1511377.1 metallophosphoesterase [Bradyrhizobium sp. 190]